MEGLKRTSQSVHFLEADPELKHRQCGSRTRALITRNMKAEAILKCQRTEWDISTPTSCNTESKTCSFELNLKLCLKVML